MVVKKSLKKVGYFLGGVAFGRLGPLDSHDESAGQFTSKTGWLKWKPPFLTTQKVFQGLTPPQHLQQKCNQEMQIS